MKSSFKIVNSFEKRDLDEILEKPADFIQIASRKIRQRTG